MAAREHRCVVALAAGTEVELRQRAASKADALCAGAPSRPAEHSAEPFRLAVDCATASEAAAELAAFAAGAPSRAATRVVAGRPRVAFVFAGQSELSARASSALHAGSPAFRSAMDRCDASAARASGVAASALLYGSPDAALLGEARHAQPMLVALECALAAAWRDWGVTPDAVTGHSLGEYAALQAAGGIELEDVIALVAERGRLTDEHARPGGMAVAMGTPEDVQRALDSLGGQVEIAAENAPAVVALSGPASELERARTQLEGAGISTVPLQTTHAFHSACVDGMLDALAQRVADTPLMPTAMPFASTLEGRLLPVGAWLGPAYWRSHARTRVRFVEAVRALSAARCTIFLELGPHATLTGLGRRCAPDPDAVWTSSLRRDADERDTLLRAATALWLSGVDVSVDRIAAEVGPP